MPGEDCQPFQQKRMCALSQQAFHVQSSRAESCSESRGFLHIACLSATLLGGISWKVKFKRLRLMPPTLWQAFLQVLERTERSPIFGQAFSKSCRGRSARQFFGNLFCRARRGRSARQFFGNLFCRSRRGGALANFSACLSAGPAEDRALAFFRRKKQHEKAEQHTALSLKRGNGHRRRGYVRGNVGLSIALIGRCLFLEIC